VGCLTFSLDPGRDHLWILWSPIWSWTWRIGFVADGMARPVVSVGPDGAGPGLFW